MQLFLNSTTTVPDASTLEESDRIWGETIMNDDTVHEATAETTVETTAETTAEGWSVQPFLGLVPHFHVDPVEGVPLVSTDGHWWWDGYAWTPAPAVAEAGAHV